MSGREKQRCGKQAAANVWFVTTASSIAVGGKYQEKSPRNYKDRQDASSPVGMSLMSLVKVIGEAEPKYVGYPVFGANRPRIKQLTFGRTKDSCPLFIDDVATHKHTLHEVFCQLNST